MALNAAELAKSDFWEKKIRAVHKVRDVDKDGFITRADYMIIIQRYRDMGSSQEHLERLKHVFDALCNSLGLAGDSQRVTHDDIVANFGKSSVDIAHLAQVFDLMFDAMDSDGSDLLSFKEWVDYYRAVGIDTAYARASFDAMDTDGDGVVSKKEFYDYNKEYYYSTEDKLHSSIMFGPLD